MIATTFILCASDPLAVFLGWTLDLGGENQFLHLPMIAKSSGERCRIILCEWYRQEQLDYRERERQKMRDRQKLGAKKSEAYWNKEIEISIKKSS